MVEKTFTGGLFTVHSNNLQNAYVYLGFYCRHPSCLHSKVLPNAPCQFIIHPWIDKNIEYCYHNTNHVLILPEHVQAIKNLIAVTSTKQDKIKKEVITLLESFGYIYLPENQINGNTEERLKNSCNYDFVRITELQDWSNFSNKLDYMKDLYILLKIDAHKKKRDKDKLHVLNLAQIYMSQFIMDQLKIKNRNCFEPTSMNIKTVTLPDIKKYAPLGVYF